LVIVGGGCPEENNHMGCFTSGKASAGKTGDNWNVKHVAFGIAFSTVLSYAFLVSNYLSIENGVILMAFNLVFVSMTFPLNGALTTKVALLLACEVVGSLWTKIFSLLAGSNEGIASVFSFLGPFVNLGWMITFYSVTLTILASTGREG